MLYRNSCSEDCCGCEVCCYDDYEDDKCSCGSAGTSLHGCPFSEEIHDDYDRLCNCCDACSHECAQDIQAMIYKVYGKFNENREFLFKGVDLNFDVNTLSETLLSNIRFMGMIDSKLAQDGPLLYIDSEYGFRFEKEERKDILRRVNGYIRDNKINTILNESI